MTGESDHGHLFPGKNENLEVVQSTRLNTLAALFRIKDICKPHIQKVVNL